MRSVLLIILFVFCAILTEGRAAQQSAKIPPNVLIVVADDMSPDAGVYGNKAVATPSIDRFAADAVVFDNAFCAAPSCTASRASILTGRHPHELKEGGNLWSTLSTSFPNYTTLLAVDGYRIGLTGKGWGPGDYTLGGYTENPAGPQFESFETFLLGVGDKKPFCFWLGSKDPHRPYDPALRKKAGSKPEDIVVPAWLPDHELVREDLLDYYAEINRFDKTVGSAIALLKEKGLFHNTLIIITSDNGMPFPRAKANLYDGGTNIPLIMRWGDRFKNGTRYTELVSLMDLAPTILDAADLSIPKSMTARSLLPLLIEGKKDDRFNAVFLERERHAYVRNEGLSYPMRAIRTADYLYIRNLRPDRWPAGAPDFADGRRPYGDIDNGLSKKFLTDHVNDPPLKKFTDASFGKRPAEELYDLRKDPDQLHNVVEDPSYDKVKARLGKRLSDWRNRTNDPVGDSGADIFDTYPYYGGGNRK